MPQDRLSGNRRKSVFVLVAIFVVALTIATGMATVAKSRIVLCSSGGAGVVSGDVNGIPFTPTNGAYSVANVSPSQRSRSRADTRSP